jgi:aminopeptidase N
MKYISFPVLLLILNFGLAAQTADIYQRPLQSEPDRDFDALHYCVELDLNMNEKSLTGQNTITLLPLRGNLNQVMLDAVSLVVTDVLDKKGVPLLFEQTEEKLHINLSRNYSFTDTVEFVVKYFLKEQVKGLRFIDKSVSNPDQVSSDCWPNKARQWIPCYDYPHDKVTQEMIITVNKKYKVLSNGSLVGVKEEKDSGKHTYHWRQMQPHSTYLINLSIADYAVIQDSLGKLPVNYWVYHSNVDDAKRSFSKTPYMIDFFNKLFQYEYPWDKYDQVISTYMRGGAEATSATLLGEAAVINAKAAIDFSYEGIIAHEIAHQWWGDLITCRSWEHTWMNESFATYSDYLYKKYAWGEDEAAWDLMRKKNSYLREAQTRYMRPIVFNRYETPEQNFDSHTYPKGACVLHMLRFVLGDETFFRTLSEFLHKFEFQAVSTQDFMKCVKDVSGKNMDWFFDQFLFHPGHLVLDITKSWNESTKTLILEIKQTQDKWENVPVYRMPVDIGLYTATGKTIKKVWLEQKTETFEFIMDSEPLMVRFDEGNHLLMELTFKKPEGELLYQVKNDDVTGRLWAIDELKTFGGSQKTIDIWSDLAMNDSFWAVREAAINNLSVFHHKESRDIFLKATSDKSSKVKAAAVKALGDYRDNSMTKDFRKLFETDDSYLVMAEALKAIGNCGDKSQSDFLKGVVNEKTYPAIVKNAAEQAIEKIK